MSALFHPQPPPRKLIIKSADSQALVRVANFIEENDKDYEPSFYLDADRLCIEFVKTPDIGIQNLINSDVYRICNDAEVTWEVTSHESTPKQR